MKTSIRLKFAAFILLTTIISIGIIPNASSQVRQSRHEKVVKTRKINRHRHLKSIYRPHWAKKTSFSRRWVYFPKYNFYWDNARNKYVYLNNGVWVVKKKQPKYLVNVSLETEKMVELSEDDDLVDNIQENNEKHIVLKVD